MAGQGGGGGADPGLALCSCGSVGTRLACFLHPSGLAPLNPSFCFPISYPCPSKMSGRSDFLPGSLPRGLVLVGTCWSVGRGLCHAYCGSLQFLSPFSSVRVSRVGVARCRLVHISPDCQRTSRRCRCSAARPPPQSESLWRGLSRAPRSSRLPLADPQSLRLVPSGVSLGGRHPLVCLPRRIPPPVGCAQYLRQVPSGSRPLG